MKPEQDYYIVTNDGYLPRLVSSRQVALDLEAYGWSVVRVVEVEPVTARDGMGER